jgi:hypothetical protein
VTYAGGCRLSLAVGVAVSALGSIVLDVGRRQWRSGVVTAWRLRRQLREYG